MEYNSDNQIYGNSDEQIYGNSAFSSESDSDYTEDLHRAKKKKVKAPKSVEIITENLPPKRNNENSNRNNHSCTNSNASTLIQINDNIPPPVKKKSFSSKLFSKISKLFWWKKKKEIVTLTKEEKKKLKKKKEKRNCCLIIILIIIIILLLGNIAALDVAYVAYRNSPLSNITTLVNNATDVQEQNLKSIMCSTILGTIPIKEYNCDFCWDVNSFANVTNFCMLKSIFNNAFNQTMFTAVGWMSDRDYCRWVGINCDDANNIIEMSLKFPVVPRVFDGRIGRLKPLQKLTIIGGLVEGEAVPLNLLPPSIFELENLQRLELTFTGFRGKIPNTFDKMTSLKILRIIGNRGITGPMPDSISSTSLTNLVYTKQNVTGPIPDFIGNSPSLQQSLQFLDLSGNQFTGNLPDSLMNLPNIKSLSVATNLLSGEFPISITTSKFAKNLLFLDLSTNGFTGIIPPAIAQCENLGSINLAQNSLSGPIPAELSKLPLAALIISFNKLTGNIPASIGDLNITRLFMSGNQLTGTVPNSICQRKYAFCDLSRNQIPFQACLVCSV